MSRIKKKNLRAKKIFGTTERPRMAVNKSLKHIKVQVIDDTKGLTLAAAASDSNDKNNIETAKKVGKLIAEKAKTAGITAVVFDRRNYLYHGKVKALAEAAKSAGLKF